MHQVWLREKGIYIVAGEKLRRATKSFVEKLQAAVKHGTDGRTRICYYGGEKMHFLEAARLELGSDAQAITSEAAVPPKQRWNCSDATRRAI